MATIDCVLHLRLVLVVGRVMYDALNLVVYRCTKWRT